MTGLEAVLFAFLVGLLLGAFGVLWLEGRGGG